MPIYRELLAKESPEMQACVAERVEEASIQIALSALRDELNISQIELATMMGENSHLLPGWNRPTMIRGYQL